MQNLIVGSWNSEKRIFWLQGPAGAGKSAIAQTIAEIFEEKQMLAGSFFFARGKGGCDNVQSFVATLCYWLCLVYPKKRREVGRIVLHDQSVLYQTLDIQFQKLIAEPFRRSKTSSTHPYWRSRRFVVVIDGLDECDSEHDQLTLLRNITFLIRVHGIPLSFLVTSRPVPHIREYFRDDITISLIHHEIFLKPSTDDVQIFLSSEFSKIRKRSALIPESWPSEDVIRVMIEKSSGYFIYPSTILRFIDDADSRPTAQLDIVLSGKTNPAYLEMDQLYLNILSMVRKPRDLLVQVLGIIMVAERRICALDVDLILNLPPGETSLVLRRLHPILDSADDNHISVLHGTFSDFLCDSDRAGKFFVNLDEHHAAFAQRCLEYMASYGSSNTNSPSPIWLSEFVLPYWDINISKVKDTSRRQILLNNLDAISLDQWSLVMKFKLSHPFGHILFDNQLFRIMTWAESFEGLPQDKIHHLMAIRDMWYRVVVESIPLLKTWSLEQLILPFFHKNKRPSEDPSQGYIWMGTFPGFPERGGSDILPPHSLCLTTRKPEVQYYITSHLNPNASFIEFLCDGSRSMGLYDLTAAHTYVIKLCTKWSHKVQLERCRALWPYSHKDDEDWRRMRYSTEWIHNLLHCPLGDDSLVTCLNVYFVAEGEKREIQGVFGWVEKELRIAPDLLTPRPVLLFLFKWVEYLEYGSGTSSIQELSSPQDYNCTFEIYLARVCVSRFKRYFGHWYDNSKKHPGKKKGVHAPRSSFWIASDKWRPLKPGSLIRRSDQYRSIISFLLGGSKLEWQTQKGNLYYEFSRICSDGRNSLKSEDGNATLLEKYPICDGWKCSWNGCNRVLVDMIEMDGHCLEHFHSFWLSHRRSGTELDFIMA
ncbi:hypothetical protein BDZ94DRAFT_1220850 [Collybia nuda]|uniref:NACHT domain-containing protein n=1 Tax=Collybia nuda TaxID=64659 RepID=A0A9P5Y3Z0_9AGAR|nr:hypothetical protein BDZ94DRAFT_1220850 [Collybia nuda]